MAIATKPSGDKVDIAHMPRSRRKALDSITFRITISGEELTRWHFAAAEQRGLSIAALVHRAVERELAVVKRG